MTPDIQRRFDALPEERQQALLPMINDLLTTVENQGCALLLADPLSNGRAAMLSVGDVHYVSQLLQNGADAYATLFEKSVEVTRQ